MFLRKIFKIYYSTFSDLKIEKFKPRLFQKVRIIGITRIRNEELIIADTLEHISKFVDIIIVLDDDSNDETLEIVKQNDKVGLLLRNTKWRINRLEEETRHRWLLSFFAKFFLPNWIFYFDADERFEGIDNLSLENLNLVEVDAIRISLFDAYLTSDDNQPLQKGQKLWNLRTLFGPERRDIVMLWRNKPNIKFVGLDRREPIGFKHTATMFYCQHYGKALSIDHWEQTCDYYSKYFQGEYKMKWEERKGKSIHTLSDFDRPLYSWDDVKKTDVKIHPKN